MKRLHVLPILAGCLLLGLPALHAQQTRIQYIRPNNQYGLNVFEPTKADSGSFHGLKVAIGGNFTQDFQALSDRNTAEAVMNNGTNVNQLLKLTDGLNLAMANLNLDVQLADGIRLNLTTYLSTRHHQDTWVKGGYIQFDKLGFLNSPGINKLMNHLTLKIGDFDPDYGDAHFRRTDGGNSIHNPFVENYIMDAFTTEVGGELMYQSNQGVFALAGLSDGELNPSVTASSTVDAATGNPVKADPAVHVKLGYDKQLSTDVRFRLSGSAYLDKSSPSNTLYWGDRTGSHYFLVMENTSASSSNNAWSGRFNPLFSQEVHAVMINPFLKYKGLEFLGTYEHVSGRTSKETSLRSDNQLVADLVYRFPAEKQHFWIGARYNTLGAELPGISGTVHINRVAGSAGWFMTPNVMMKVEYVDQVYSNFPSTDIRSGGEFNGLMVEASVGF